MITFRPFTTADIPAGLLLCRTAGWNQVEQDWQVMLGAEACHAIAACDERGSVIGSATTIQYENSFAWIGMVLVHPDFQRMGLGSALLQKTLEQIGPVITPRLDATPAGRAVYLKLKFTDEYALVRMQCDQISAFVPDGDQAVTAMTPSDIESIREWDRNVFAADRHVLLSALLASPGSNSVVLSDHNGIQGYCLSRRGYNFFYVGPVVAKHIDDAKILLRHVLVQYIGKSVVLDIPDDAVDWKAFLYSIGFTQQRTFIRMYQGKIPPEGNKKQCFAIAGPEYG